MQDMGKTTKLHKGRGATLSPDNRFAEHVREPCDDGWGGMEHAADPVRTSLGIDKPTRIITYNKSPDVPFDRSINPYKGCEHGCVYCFARPTHAWLDLSPGLDFESRLFYKPDAAELLKKELGAKNYQCAPVAIGANTDAYQPVERQQQLTRGLIELLIEARHPFAIITKSALIERDVDLLQQAASLNLVSIYVSVTTLDKQLARNLEPRASAPVRRLETIQILANAGIPVSVLVAPIIPVLTESELETILAESRDAGARCAGYILLRLPHELKLLFRDWLLSYYPNQVGHVMNRISEMHGGQEYDHSYGTRMSGQGLYADLLAKRFALAVKRLGFEASQPLDCSGFNGAVFDLQYQLFE